MQYRKDLINHFIKKFNYTSYLEIGVRSESKTFNHIICSNKEGVDPNGCTTHSMTSNKFFETIDMNRKWDIIFIDGWHERLQVKQDIENSLLHLNDNGTIVCHDVNPREEYLLQPEYCWNAWEAFAELRTYRDDLEMHGVTFDHCGFIRKGRQNIWSNKIEYTWAYLNKNRLQLMQELNTDQFKEKYFIN